MSDLAPHPGLPGYSVTIDGRVWSDVSQRWLTPKLSNRGYLRVGPSVGGKQVWRFVHRLVLQAHVGQCPEGMEAAHLDGDPGNNTLENLAWTTRSQNKFHRVLHGTAPYREAHGSAVLTWAQVIDIRDRYDAGTATQAELAREHQVTWENVHAIVNHRTWKEAI